MTVESFNESVNADIRRMTNKANESEPEIRTALKSYLNPDFNKKLDAYLAKQGEPTSFSAWLEANGDSIEPLDRTEATAQWFDNKAKDEGSPFA